MADASTLTLVCESKIRDLMPRRQSIKRLEASGVLARDGYYFVVFDNRAEIARISDDLLPNGRNGLFGMACAKHGYEGIAYNAAKQRFYLLVESVKQKSGDHKAQVFEYDDEFRYLKHRPVEFNFEDTSKGFEAAAHLRRDGTDYLLALCEGNKCKSGKQGSKPGGGRVQLFEKKKKRWAHRDTIKLPPSLPFEDYSAMAIEEGRAAVVSQVNSMLWIGRFDEDTWSWRDAGQLYDFPRSGTGSIMYGNVEGVDWVDAGRIVTVSDKRKKKQPDRKLSEKDQSIHLFDVPT